MRGNFLNHTRQSNNVIRFHATHPSTFRFLDKPERTSRNITGRWQVIFDGEDPDNRVAVGQFYQEGNRLTGTFFTPTGDYRYLEGEIGGDHLSLSCFDGSHAFLFVAKITDDHTISGEFFSGTHWHDTWTAWRNDSAILPDPESMTFMKPNYHKITFNLPDETGKLISWEDPRFQNKVLIIQLMGSWCPNCMDETRFLSSFYKLFRDKGVEIVALDFEKVTDSASVWKSIRRLKKHFDVTYPVLYAGSADKTEAAKILPMLNKVIAYPTTIFSDKQGFVKMIHTGFSGPATGREYELLTDKFDNFVWKLLKE
jgi:thiol-disulfide isomerase/thioredoxin